MSGNRLLRFMALFVAVVILPGSDFGGRSRAGGTPDYFNTPTGLTLLPCGSSSTRCRDWVSGTGTTWTSTSGGHPDTRRTMVDYYEIELGEYSEKMHSDLPPRGCGIRQTNTADNSVAIPVPGPLIVARETGRSASSSRMRSPPAPAATCSFRWTTRSWEPGRSRSTTTRDERAHFLDDRHVQGDRPPFISTAAHSVISDGTPHQWITPRGEDTQYPKVRRGVCPRHVVRRGWKYDRQLRGQTTCGVAAPRQPRRRAQTFYWTNQQSARLMFYHDHAWAITRLNVYVAKPRDSFSPTRPNRIF